MLNGRELIKKSTEMMNATGILLKDIRLPSDIDTAQNEQLESCISYFLDCVESVPENKENLIPSYVISAYNNIVDKNVTFDSSDASEPFDLDSIVYRRTKFYDR